MLDILTPEELSIGDFVLNGGEVGAMVVIDAVVRLIPEFLGDEESSIQDSFSSGNRWLVMSRGSDASGSWKRPPRRSKKSARHFSQLPSCKTHFAF